MRTIKTTSGVAIALDGDLLAIMEALYREVTATRVLDRSFDDMVQEIRHLIEQMTEDNAARPDIVALANRVRVVRSEERERRVVIDWAGSLLYLVGVTGLMSALAFGGIYGWTTPWIAGGIVGAAGAFHDGGAECMQP